MSKVIIYDYEVFKYDTLFGGIIINEEGKEELFQNWNLEEIKKFISEHKTDLYVGHNNFNYDDKISDAIMHDENTYTTSKKIVEGQMVQKCRTKIYSVDLMKLFNEDYSLKLCELICGKNIDTTEVDFELDRKLDDNEKKLTESYNYSDLDQTKFNYYAFIDLIKLRFDMIKEFNLDINEGFKASITTLAEKIFKIKPNGALKYQQRKPVLYDNLKIENQDILDFYINEKFKEGTNPTIEIDGFEITLGKGGGHGALKCYHSDKVMYVDVSGYYNLIALLYDLLPRNFTPKHKEQ